MERADYERIELENNMTGYQELVNWIIEQQLEVVDLTGEKKPRPQDSPWSKGTDSRENAAYQNEKAVKKIKIGLFFAGYLKRVQGNAILLFCIIFWVILLVYFAVAWCDSWSNHILIVMIFAIYSCFAIQQVNLLLPVEDGTVHEFEVSKWNYEWYQVGDEINVSVHESKLGFKYAQIM